MDANERRFKELKLEKLRRTRNVGYTPQKEQGFTSEGAAEAMAVNAGQGLTSEFGDEILAAIVSGKASGPEYERKVKQYRDKVAQTRSDYPVVSLAGGIAGAAFNPINKGGPLMSTLSGAATGVGGAEGDDNLILEGVKGATMGLGASALTSGATKLFDRPDTIRARSLGAGSKGMSEGELKNAKKTVNYLSKRKAYTTKRVKYNTKKGKFVADRNEINVLRNKYGLEKNHTLEELYQARYKRALDDIHVDTDKILSSSGIKGVMIGGDDLSNELNEVAANHIRRSVNPREAANKIYKAVDGIKDAIDKPIVKNNKIVAKELSTLKELNQVKQNLQKEASYSIHKNSTGLEDFYRDAAAVTRKKIESLAGKEGERLIDLNKTSHKLLNQIDDLNMQIGRKESQGMGAYIYPYSNPKMQAVKGAETIGSIPIAAKIRSDIGEKIQKIPEPLRDAAGAGAIYESGTIPKRIDDQIDPETGTYREPQSLKSMIPDQTNIPKSIMKTRLPRNFEEILKTPEFFKAKLAQELNMDEQEIEDIMDDKEGFPIWIESLAQIKPDMFVRDKYNSFDNKVQDPAMRQLATKDIYTRTDISNTDKIMAIQKLNTTGELS